MNSEKAKGGPSGTPAPTGAELSTKNVEKFSVDKKCRNAELPAEIEEYLQLVEHPEPDYPVCREQTALAALVRRAFETEDIRVDTEQLAKYMKLEKYFPFELFPWEKFLFELFNCTYKADGTPRWDSVFGLIARGAGKDGLIGFDSFCSASPYNPVPEYDVDICAMNEEQAMRPLNDLIRVLENPKRADKLNRHYYHTKVQVTGLRNGGVIRGRTNNPGGRDGMRSGKIVFNEVHAYKNYDNIKVFRSGLGKKDQPRELILTSNGEICDGPLDEFIAQAERILFEGDPDGGFLPFICRIGDRSEVDDPRNWHKANPSLRYRPALMTETMREYRDWKQHPERNGDFITKRMGLRDTVRDIAVTTYDKLIATKRSEPALRPRMSCTVGIDYAELSDWTAVNLHFRDGDLRYDVNHAWICRDSKTLERVRAPWQEWTQRGLCTFVEDVDIHPDNLAAWIEEAMKTYNVKMLAMDNFRWALLSDSLKKIGFDAGDKKRVKLVRPGDIMKVEPVIQSCFDRNLFIWGDQPQLRWAVNNTKRVRASRAAGSDTGNFYYAKIEAKSRKTDPFMALVASMTCEDVLGTGQAVTLPKIGAVKV